MLSNSQTRNSPAWWLLRLGKKLSEDQERFDKLEAYWRGTPPVPHGNRRMREAYKRLQKMARTNFGGLVAETVLERMKVTGFRAGADSTDEADKQAWDWWQANSLDADSGLVHRAAVIFSRSYVIVGEDEGNPLVTAEDPRQVIHESAPENRRKVLAAMKTWWDDTEGHYYSVVFTPDKIYYYRTDDRIKKETPVSQLWVDSAWVTDTVSVKGGVASNPFGEVPVVPFVNRPDLAGEGLGEFEDVLDVLDRINTVILDRLVISAMQAYRQRWAKGVDLTDENGNPQTVFDPGADLLWAVGSDNAQFGEFNPTDLTPLVKAIESDVQYLSSITRTPPHYLLAGIVNASGDALSVAETGLVSKLLERETEFGESWERVYRLVGEQQGRTIDADCEVLWKDPQFRTLAELASASVQLKAADVPWRTRMRFLDMSPAEIDRMDAERAHDAMIAAMQQPAGMPGATPQNGQPAGQQPVSVTGAPASVQTPGAPTEGSQTSTATARTAATTDTKGGATRGSSGTNLASSSAGSSNASNMTWQQLFEAAKAAGYGQAANMTKAQLMALMGGNS